MQSGTKPKTKLTAAAPRPPFPLGSLRRKEGGSPAEKPIEEAHIAATAAAINLLAERWRWARERAQVVPELILADAKS
jgi:hypothetical protein